MFIPKIFALFLSAVAGAASSDVHSPTLNTDEDVVVSPPNLRSLATTEQRDLARTKQSTKPNPNSLIPALQISGRFTNDISTNKKVAINAVVELLNYVSDVGGYTIAWGFGSSKVATDKEGITTITVQSTKLDNASDFDTSAYLNELKKLFVLFQNLGLAGIIEDICTGTNTSLSSIIQLFKGCITVNDIEVCESIICKLPAP